ncbi:MAG: electron transfer flavoprotein subunit beta/FixA family protein [Desulfurococcales archaeon]|nr:electron transfer flavoprotein subunit beta/FixA family protein [Desulfurococcales archaeon]MEB3786762.1 electron transfer flavoprotein subunit beta/FixA family protein [Desulfurococcales archaeon]MEB3799131.1 electron transfer flavoprotein subunit beta/FixA family protein [Desulfurococcales archaeon]MEB3845646.1 electron transfer flavoprotein subunit beta/FixA family protein [Desulfurococcales archaeon]
MRIVLGIKWVPNTQAVRFDPKTGTLIREGVPSIVNPHDLDATEFALKLKDKFGGRITAITMAPPAAIMGLQHVIGMGVDDGILASDRAFAGADTLATSYVLAKVIERIGDVDLVVFGQETIDSSTAHIGAQVASWLKLPYVYYVEELVDYDESKKEIVFRRKLEDREEVYKVKLPAVISVAMHSQKPRPVRMSYKIRAKLENPIQVWTNKDMGLDPRCIGLKGSPTIVAGITWTPEVPRKKQVFKGDPKEAVKWLIEKLKEEGVLPF